MDDICDFHFFPSSYPSITRRRSARNYSPPPPVSLRVVITSLQNKNTSSPSASLHHNSPSEAVSAARRSPQGGSLVCHFFFFPTDSADTVSTFRPFIQSYILYNTAALYLVLPSLIKTTSRPLPSLPVS